MKNQVGKSNLKMPKEEKVLEEVVMLEVMNQIKKLSRDLRRENLSAKPYGIH